MNRIVNIRPMKVNKIIYNNIVKMDNMIMPINNKF